MTLNQHNMINSGFRGFICAGLATIITASLSWTFVISSDSLQWMGGGHLVAPTVAHTAGLNGFPGEQA